MSSMIAVINDLEHIFPLTVISVFLIIVSAGIEVHYYTAKAWTKGGHLVDPERLTKSLVFLIAIDVLFILPLGIDSSPEFCIFVLLIRMGAFVFLSLRFSSNDDFDLFLAADYIAVTSIFVNVDDPFSFIFYFFAISTIGFFAWKLTPSVRKLALYVISVLSVLAPVLANIVLVFFLPQTAIVHTTLLLLLYSIFKAIGSFAVVASDRL